MFFRTRRFHVNKKYYFAFNKTWSTEKTKTYKICKRKAQ